MTTPNWKDLEFLQGEWDASGGGQPGEGKGSVSFSFELGGRIFVRRNHLEFAAQGDSPSFTHDDTLITYLEESGEMRAIYFDNEGHVIHYRVSLEADGRIVYLSDAVPSAPRFRMSYLKGEGGACITRFEIAPPGNPEGFVTHVEGPARRK